MRRHTISVAVVASLVFTACAGTGEATEEEAATEAEVTTTTAAPETTTTSEMMDHELGADEVDPEALLPAYLGAAPFQDVEVAEAAGWANTVETLGCFENPGVGGMGVHWLNESLLDDVVDASSPEALVYELAADGEIVGLVGHEYLVPLEAWTDDTPPELFGLAFHEHPVLPFWILHAYLWKENPAGMFNDWNPAIRMCPDGVGVFGVDLP